MTLKEISLALLFFGYGSVFTFKINIPGDEVDVIKFLGKLSIFASLIISIVFRNW